MTLPTVDAARDAMLAALSPLAGETVRLVEADGRWLLTDLIATRHQPPFNASAMDGWAVRTEDLGLETLTIVGESAAGRGREAPIGRGETVRISTGAPLPSNADRVVMQEDATRAGDRLMIRTAPHAAPYVRERGADYAVGDLLLEAGVRLNPWRLALAASEGRPDLECARRPRVQILSTGDEVVEPGAPRGPHQIYDAAGPGVAAIARRSGAEVSRLTIVGDTVAAIATGLRSSDCDLLVTIGGASVGDHDLLKPAARDLGAQLVVEGVALRPGKPVWFATLPDGRFILGLPGNPVSAMVCAELFLVPILAALQGGQSRPRFETASSAEALDANGARDHYMRAALTTESGGLCEAKAASDQDSSLVKVMASSNGLLRRAPGAPSVEAGGQVEVLRLDV